MGSIYLIRNTVNGKWYVGKTHKAILSRWREHVMQAITQRGRGCPALHRAIRKYGASAFTVEPLALCVPLPILCFCETFALILLRNLSNCKTYKLTDGGEGIPGYKRTNASRSAMSEIARANGYAARLPHILSEEQCNKISKALHGIKRSAATKERLRLSHLGQSRPWTEEHRANFMAARRRTQCGSLS